MQDLDLVIEPGERVLLLGASGAGKSTLLAALAGLLDPAHAGDATGQLLVDGLDPRAARDRVGLVLQDPEVQLVMARAGDDVAFGLENRAVPADEIWPRVDGALRDVGFRYGRDRRTDQLSGGEQQRLTLAGALALGPRLLLLDEPTANLDPGGAASVRTAIAAATRSASATTIMVEHRVADTLPLVNRVIVLEPGGGVMAAGSPASVFATHGATLAEAGVWIPDSLTKDARDWPGGAEFVASDAPTGVSWADSVTQSASSGVWSGVKRRARNERDAGDGEASFVTETHDELIIATEVSLTHRGAEAPALDRVSVALRGGEALAVVGPNGSGKSTLASLLAGLVAPTSGSVRGTARLAGRDAVVAPHRWRARDLAERIGTVFQDPEHQFLTGRVRDELAFGPMQRGESSQAVAKQVDELLDRLHLTHLAEANPFTLSGGEKRRLSVATALTTSPRVLVLDEPTFGQDRRTWLELVGLLAAHRDDGGAICTITHDEAVVESLADRVLILDAGRVVANLDSGQSTELDRGRVARAGELSDPARQPRAVRSGGGVSTGQAGREPDKSQRPDLSDSAAAKPQVSSPPNLTSPPDLTSPSGGEPT